MFSTFTRPARLRALLVPLRLYQKAGLEALVRRMGIPKLLPARLRALEALLPQVPAQEVQLAGAAGSGHRRERTDIGRYVGDAQRRHPLHSLPCQAHSAHDMRLPCRTHKSSRRDASTDLNRENLHGPDKSFRACRRIDDHGHADGRGLRQGVWLVAEESLGRARAASQGMMRLLRLG